MDIELRKGGALSKSGEVDQPWEVVMSKRRRCLSEEPETTRGGVKSIDAILRGWVSVSYVRTKYPIGRHKHTLCCGGSRTYVGVGLSLHPRVG